MSFCKSSLGAFCLFFASCADHHDVYSGKKIEDVNMAMDVIEYRESKAPEVGDRAPDVNVIQQSTGKLVPIGKNWATKPAVIIFGSITCDQTFRGINQLKRLQQRFGPDHNFVFVYVREAHPTDGWHYGSKKMPKAKNSPTTEIRTNISHRFCNLHSINFPTFVDPVDDRAAIAYASWPVRIYVIDTKGIIRYRSVVGPWGFKPTKDFIVMYPFAEPGDRIGFVPDVSNMVSLEEFLENYHP